VPFGIVTPVGWVPSFWSVEACGCAAWSKLSSVKASVVVAASAGRGS
jgi:hypothetical protein